MKPLVLICSQEAGSYLMLSHILKVDGFDVALVEDAEEAIESVSTTPVRAIILDCKPDFHAAPLICARLKSEDITKVVPVVATVTTGCDQQNLDLLKAGIDQSFVCPYAPDRLLAYLNVLGGPKIELSPGDAITDDTLSVGKLRLFTKAYRAEFDGVDIPLRLIQFRLLCVMVMDPGRVFSRDELIITVWPDNVHVEPRTVDVHIGRLRQKLKNITGQNLIRTVRSAGYAFESRTAS